MVTKFIVSLLLVFIYIYFKTKKSFHMLQQNWYNEGNRYLKWIIKNPYKVFIEYDMIFVVFIVFLFMNSVVSYIVVSILYFSRAFMQIKPKLIEISAGMRKPTALNSK